MKGPEYPPEFDDDDEGAAAEEKTLHMLESRYGTVDPKKLTVEFYKNTECGGWLRVEDDGLRIGSIVEGAQVDAPSRTMKHPVSPATFSENVAALESDAYALWHEWNEPRRD